MFDIEEELKKLPLQPGVYIMHDEHDVIIYVGKAINLKNRVRQYFQSSRNMTVKIQKMVSKISRFEYIVTDSELEALILECNLIKEHQPKYNTMLKDSKGYPYIKVTVNERFPRVMMARECRKDRAKYFGPYTNTGAVNDTIELIRKIYNIRTCNKNLPKDTNNDRPCLYFHIKQCIAPCKGYITEEEYRKSIHQVLGFLGGNYVQVTRYLEEKMQTAAMNMEYELAGEYRDLITKVKDISQKQKITNIEQEDKDIIAFAIEGEEAVVQIFFIRSGKLMGREHFHLSGVDKDSKNSVMTNFVKQFYAGTPFIPKELILQEEIEDEEIITEWLSKKRGQKVYIKVPQKGEKERLVELAAKNAALVLQQDSEKFKKEEERTTGAVKEITDIIGISNIVTRIESYDISNINGFESVGSMVVYENGKPKRSDYRKFKIKDVKGPDDYKSLEEVLTRRFVHGQKEQKELNEKNIQLEYGSFTKFPDLILMDGGKGQVNIALNLLKKLNLDIDVCGMVKDDSHRTRGLYYNNKEIPINKNSEAFKLITRIQDETHRFAIEYHQSLRSKKQVHSILDDIKGIGTVRRKALMKHFKSIEKIKEATVDQLKSVDSMNELSANKVYDFFH